jgi:hypothetical protein
MGDHHWQAFKPPRGKRIIYWWCIKCHEKSGGPDQPSPKQTTLRSTPLGDAISLTCDEVITFRVMES